MKVDKKLVSLIIPFAPLVMIFAALVMLGSVFLRAYDTGRPMPRAPGSGLLIAAPSINAAEDAQAIADTMKSPETLPQVSAPQSAIPADSTEIRETPPLTNRTLPEQSKAANALQQVVEKLEETTHGAPQIIEPSLDALLQATANVVPRALD